MHIIIFSVFSLIITTISSLSIPFINNAFLQPLTYVNISIRLNSSCDECLCDELILNNKSDYIALNCFVNRTCQYFQNFSSLYRINSSSGNRIYFLQNKFPTINKCCMPNITELLIQLQNAVPVVLNLTFPPAAFGYDETKPYEAAVTGFSTTIIYWFNPFTMTFIRNFTIGASLFLAVYNNQTFTAADNTPLIHIRDSQTSNYLGNISYPSFNQIRKLIFIDNEQRAIIPTQANFSLTFLNVNSPMNYTVQNEIPFPLRSAHGIAKVNDSLIYVSTWSNRSIISYKYENLSWTPSMFVSYTITGDGSHLAVDDCERIWYINTAFGLRIFDQSGIEIGNWNMSLNSTNTIYDLLFLPNYILLITFRQSKKIVQYNPQLTCS